jgi:hypothetical protein
MDYIVRGRDYHGDSMVGWFLWLIRPARRPMTEEHEIPTDNPRATREPGWMGTRETSPPQPPGQLVRRSGTTAANLEAVSTNAVQSRGDLIRLAERPDLHSAGRSQPPGIQ